MQMNSLFAAGLFDEPWIVALVVIAGALVNWLSKRRQEMQARQPSKGDEPSPSAGNRPREGSLEETLRRLIGEEPPAPPRIPGEDPSQLPPVPERQEEEPFQSVWQTVPPSAPPLLEVLQS